jgi:hypothetical protein
MLKGSDGAQKDAKTKRYNTPDHEMSARLLHNADDSMRG